MSSLPSSYLLVDFSLTLHSLDLPSDVHFIHDVGSITYTPKGKMLFQEPHLFYVALWIVGYLGNTDNYLDPLSGEVVSPLSFEPLYLTDHEGSLLSGVTKYQFSKVKNILRNRGFIDYRVAQTEEVVIGKTKRRRNLKGCKYRATQTLKGQLFKYYDASDPLVIDLHSFKNQTPDLSHIHAASQPKKFVPKYTALPKSIRGKHKGSFKYEAFFTSQRISESMHGSLMNEKCGKVIMSHGKNKDRFSACLMILDLVFKRRKPTLEMPEWTMNVIDGNDELFYLADEFVPVSQNLLLSCGFNQSQFSESKTVLKNIGWIEPEREDEDKSDERTTNQAHQGEKYYKGVRSKAYRLTYEYFKDFRSSESTVYSHTAKLKRTTPYRSLQALSLDPKVFDHFDEIAESRDKPWTTEDRKTQYEKLINFDYHRGEFDQKEYSPLIKNSRVTTFVAGLPKEFRDFILMDGEPTVEIDLASAHALIVSQFMKEGKRRDDWIKLVQTGKLYEDMMSELKLPQITVKGRGKYQKEYKTRSLIKKAFSSYLNGMKRKEKFDEIITLNVNFADWMDGKHPILQETIEDLMIEYSCGVNDDGKPKGNNGAALKLQEVESDCVGTYFMCESKYDCVSIHDGLLVKESEADEIIGAVKARGLEILGFPVVVERK